MYPAARRLDSLITQHNESTAFFMTWGWKYGGQHTIGGYSSPLFVDYFHMQESVRVAYESIATELSATLCPVGMAWKRARTIDTLVDLWMSDNYHPTLKGSYLTACVFYSVFFHTITNLFGTQIFADFSRFFSVSLCLCGIFFSENNRQTKRVVILR